MKFRFPATVYRSGQEPDARFSLANERTFLAWIRTSLALIAAGVALEALVIDMHPGLRFAAATVFIGLGLVAAVHSWLTWARTETSLRRGQALPGAAVSGVIAAGVVVAIALTATGLLVR